MKASFSLGVEPLSPHTTPVTRPNRHSGALVLLEALQREPPVAPGGTGRHRHRHEGGLRDLRVRGPRLGRLLRVGLDAPGALGDLGDPERDQLLRPVRERPVLERLLIELEEGPVGLRDQLPHALELRRDVDPVEFHARLLCAAHSTVTGVIPHTSSAYWRIVRSLENLPMWATFRIDMRVQAAWSR